MTVLKDLYFGNITPLNDYKQNPRTETKIYTNNQNIEELRLCLETDKQRSLLDRLLNSQSSLIALTEKDAFLAGFKLGIKVMVEVFTD